MLAHYYLARLTLEAVTPLSIATGTGDGVFDVSLVRDANGLPTLPGSAIAGVLRHLFWDLHGQAAMQKLFGYQDGNDGIPSRLHVSWGCLQDSHGQPIEGLLLGQSRTRLERDHLLAAAVASRELPHNRDRVRINHRGAASHQGKFDRAILPAGHRFSTEITLWSEQAADPAWEQVLDLLQHPLFRLGGSTRSGLGCLKLRDAHTGHFDLQTAAGRTAFVALERGIGAVARLQQRPITKPTPQKRFISAKLKLTPHSFWRIGQGDNPHRQDSNGKTADLLPKMEQRIVWHSNPRGGASARVEPAQLLVPATALKGALAHRVAFHANRQQQRWAEDVLDNNQEYNKDTCSEVQNLFGTIEDEQGTTESAVPGRVGRVLFDDSFIPFTTNDLQLMMHNSIDRFTGGVREHMLFMEELVWQKEIEMSCVIDTQSIRDSARQALHAALADLCQGRLSLGAGSGKGHGFFTGTIEWSDGGQWLPNIPALAIDPVTSATEAA